MSLPVWVVFLGLFGQGDASGALPEARAVGTALPFVVEAALPVTFDPVVGSIGVRRGGEPGTVAEAPEGQVVTGGSALSTPLTARLRSLVGLLLLMLAAWGLSVDRKLVAWRVVLWGVTLQLVFALLILRTPFGAEVMNAANVVVVGLLGFATDGASFVFGDLVYNNVPVGLGEVGNGGFEGTPGTVARTGAFFAFNVLPTIIFFSSLMTVLYHLGLMQLVVRGMAWVMRRTMRTSGAETLSAAGNVFVGMIEAPLMIKPYVAVK